MNPTDEKVCEGNEVGMRGNQVTVPLQQPNEFPPKSQIKQFANWNHLIKLN